MWCLNNVREHAKIIWQSVLILFDSRLLTESRFEDKVTQTFEAHSIWRNINIVKRLTTNSEKSTVPRSFSGC